MTTNAKYNLHDDNLNGWGFELDFTEWDTDTIVQWIELLDDDFGDDYYEKFNIHISYIVWTSICLNSNCWTKPWSSYR